MLRVKAKLITDLRVDLLRSYEKEVADLRRSRIILQEDQLYRLKQSGLLIQLGASYTPSAVLLELGDTTDIEVVPGVKLSLEQREALVRATDETPNYAGDSYLQLRRKRMEECTASQRMLLDDVRPELKSIPLILEKMEAFRREHFDLYKSTYISHSLAALLNPLVEADLLSFDLAQAALDVDTFEWWKTIAAFDCGQAMEQDMPALIPQVYYSFLLHEVLNIQYDL